MTNHLKRRRRLFRAAASFFCAAKNACKTKRRAEKKNLFTTKTRAAFVVALATLALASCARPEPPQSQYVLGTICSINLYESGSAGLYARLFGRLRELNDTFNNYSESSEISYVNQNAAAAPVAVSQDFYAVLKTALEFSRITGGAFDPTVGPLVALWGFGRNPRVPSQEEIAAAKEKVGWQNVALDDAPTVQFKKQGVRLDLGAIAKGYAADCLVQILKEEKAKRASISLGGNVYVYGKKPDGSLWNVGIRDPAAPEQNAFLLKTKNATIVTSGSYERFFEQDGKIYGHILNPATGFPSDSGLLSATIVSQTSATADALSTSLFVLGLERAAALQKSAEAGAFECVLIASDGTAYASRGLKKSLSALQGQKVIFF